MITLVFIVACDNSQPLPQPNQIDIEEDYTGQFEGQAITILHFPASNCPFLIYEHEEKLFIEKDSLGHYLFPWENFIEYNKYFDENREIHIYKDSRNTEQGFIDKCDIWLFNDTLYFEGQRTWFIGDSMTREWSRSSKLIKVD
ncbi:MAG: hypothetical protein JXR19_09410 [Bacteroidia bacterium]